MCRVYCNLDWNWFVFPLDVFLKPLQMMILSFLGIPSDVNFAKKKKFQSIVPCICTLTEKKCLVLDFRFFGFLLKWKLFNGLIFFFPDQHDGRSKTCKEVSKMSNAWRWNFDANAYTKSLWLTEKCQNKALKWVLSSLFSE